MKILMIILGLVAFATVNSERILFSLDDEVGLRFGSRCSGGSDHCSYEFVVGSFASEVSSQQDKYGKDKDPRLHENLIVVCHSSITHIGFQSSRSTSSSLERLDRIL